MNLLDLLARELESWPEGYVAIVQAGDKDCMPIDCLDIYWDGRQWDYKKASMRIYDALFHINELSSDHSTAIITRAQWQSARDKLKGESAMITPHKPKGNKDGWIRHRGGKCPVADCPLVDVRLRDGRIMLGQFSENLSWDHDAREDGDIMAYRLHAPEQAESLVNMEAMAQCAAAFGDSHADVMESVISRIDGPLTWRDRIKEIDATVIALEDERAGFIQRLADEGLALLRVDGKPMPKGPIKAEDSAQGEDMSDPANWKVGDMITFKGISDKCFTNGSQYELLSYEAKAINAVTVKEDDEGEENGWREYYFKWHSRPSKP